MAVWILPISLACTANLNSTLFSANVLRQTETLNAYLLRFSTIKCIFKKKKSCKNAYKIGQGIAPCCYKYKKPCRYKYKKNLAATETKQTLQLQLLPFLVQLSKPSSPEIHQMLVSISLNISKYLKISHDISKYFKSYHLPEYLKMFQHITKVTISLLSASALAEALRPSISNKATCWARRLIVGMINNN